MNVLVFQTKHFELDEFQQKFKFYLFNWLRIIHRQEISRCLLLKQVESQK